MSELSQERAAFKQMQSDLEASHKGQWALVYKSDLIGTFPSFDEAAQAAVAKFGRGPYLIRQIGAPDRTLPISLAFIPVYEKT